MELNSQITSQQEIFSTLDSHSGQLQNPNVSEVERMISEEPTMNITEEQPMKPVKAKKKKKKKAWGPIPPEKRSKRIPKDDVPMLEKAQALKMKNNLEVPKGKTQVHYNLSFQKLSSLATKIRLDVEHGSSCRSCVDTILDDNAQRSKIFSDSCSFIGC